MTPQHVEKTLNLLPEVLWDRWSGDLESNNINVFGWLARDDGRSDFVVLSIDENGCYYFCTSSAKYSEVFACRLRLARGLPSHGNHQPCKRVADHFQNVNAVRQNETTMRTYTFRKNDETFTIDAATYGEALSALIFHCGSEVDAAQFTFISAQ